MRGGDLSNEVPPRCLVHLDVVTVRETTTRKKWKVFSEKYEEIRLDRVALNRLWQFGVRHDVTLDLFSTGIPQDELNGIVDRMEGAYSNPFRWHVAYPSIRSVVADLPYRPDVIGVIDLPERALRYGSRYLDLTRIP